jgi:hypothetical protein
MQPRAPDVWNVLATQPQDIQMLLASAPFQWWIAGGWALDLFIGEQTRPHFDTDVAIVPAGLVNNWHRELNEVFHLNFEVFGSEGDVTDRKSNAFEKHHLLIASIDTLKVRTRMARLKAAPP